MTASTEAPRVPILIVDDEAPHVRALCDTLELEGYAPKGCESGAAALDLMSKGSFELLLTDLMMPGMDGIELITAALAVDADIAGIVMTGHATIDTAVKAMKAGACDYIVKPFRMNQLLPVIARALESRRLKRLNKELEQRIRERTRELEVANRDLEAFAYSVSHDLRAPLRVIQGFCEMFLEDHAASVPPEGLKLLGNVVSGTENLSELIEALLKFARCGREPLSVRRVSMRALVGEVLAELARQHPERSVQVSAEPLGDCWADPLLLRQVLVNLISNAYKFTAGRDPACIDIRSEPAENQTTYLVKDNGAGFDMKYAAKLFGVFQRLHTQSEFKGTGIGLSIVQRIIERHGGQVRAEGMPGQGATFRFSLPSHA